VNLRLFALNSVRTRLLLLFFAITAAAVGFVYLYVVPQLESNLTEQKLSRLKGRSAAQERTLGTARAQGLPPERLAVLLRRVSQLTDSRVTILGVRRGEKTASFVVSDSKLERGALSGGFETAVQAAAGGTTSGVESVGGQRLAEVALPIPAKHPVWITVFSEPLDEVAASVGLIRRQILIAGGIALALALVAGYYAARSISRRIGRLDEAAKKVADGDFATPIPVDSSDELGQLARTFNEMQRRLGDLDSARKQFIANASHELRTPIFSLSGFIELLEEEDPDPEARAEFVRTMREQIERLTKLTGDLLDLSRLDSGAFHISPAEVDLRDVAHEMALEFAPIADRRGSMLEVGIPTEPALAQTDPDRTRQIIRILLDNALSHTPEGTRVTMTTHNTNARAELTVSDDGPGIPRRVRQRMFERFYTGDSVSGSGLGLSIAHELAQRMGGTIEVESTKGLTAFTQDLPPATLIAAAQPAPSGAGA